MSGPCFSFGVYNFRAGMAYLERLLSCWRQRGLAQRHDGGLHLLVLVLFLAGLCGASAVVQADVLRSFGTGTDGTFPEARVVRDAAGTLYGTTSAGGTGTKGIAFKLRQNGAYTILHNFTGVGEDGDTPVAGLVRVSDGTLYGTTTLGGSSNMGVVFQLSPTLSGPYIYTTIYNFSGSDGATPQAGLIRANDGTLYGTTSAGGANSTGVVFQLSPPFTTSTSGVYTVLHHFGSGGDDGDTPMAGVIRDSAGTLYGTTQLGGSGANGVVFQTTSSGVYTTLYSFTGGADGANPQAGVIRDEFGNFYGTTSAGGSGMGVVFRLTATTTTPLHNFTGMGGTPADDGDTPLAGLFRDNAGNLYGTTSAGGSGKGVVFKLQCTPTCATATTSIYATLYNFSGADGDTPEAELVRDFAFNFYTTTFAGGSNLKGVVFKLPFYRSLHNFTGMGGTPADDGAFPFAGLIRDSTGHLYGTTSAGGGTNNVGTVFRLDPPFTTASSVTYTTLYSFTSGADGSYPMGGLVLDESTNTLYGTTSAGGISGSGVVFKLNCTGSCATTGPIGLATPLYSFTGGVDGASPLGGLVFDSASSTLYGTTSAGGGSGVVFKFQCTGSCDTATTGVYTTLHGFTGGADGASPQAGLLRDGTNLYGTTEFGGDSDVGVVFRVTTSGVFTPLHSFTGGTDGAYPFAGLILDGSGNLYSTTSAGGTSINCSGGCGVVFKLNATSTTFTTLYSFTDGADGANPVAGLVFNDLNGSLYGTTEFGSDLDLGVVFQLSPPFTTSTSATFTTLYKFTGGVNGANPIAGLIRDPNTGTLYGTTLLGGPSGRGNVFLLRAN